ncbi:type I restriction endonuclease subunit R [Microcoleus sp. FACHB-831]|jgi:hypothetical protein|uniref:type I restriction enzyme HsdR N-terminal domain-containing protein n=1 Tax=Microcoleus sp. FACHB-831 TaxID=2692827 RepID=UPI0016867BEC|nr:type I restriction enzyme HsdR N-terminal domain-containing protein [Microcoleus sp. FACHB-831]MBD1923076.1 type I restriction endonuclease subunit R [Microcoleus sp. FACHB-831]
MVQAVGITEAITSLNEAHDKLNLSQSTDNHFFREWFEGLPELTEQEKESLNGLKNRYLYHAADGAITEGTINIIMLSPLLELVQLCDPPFKIKGEASVKVELEDEDVVLQGRIDALVVQNQFWVVVIEAKRYGFTASFAIPQALAYMMANPHSERPTFGMVTNGQHYIFIKLTAQEKQYALSDEFTISKRSNNELYEVLRVMKQIAGAIA